MISIVVGFRNRDLFRVINSIESIVNQTYLDYELIFVDYGSDSSVSCPLKEYLSKYSFVKYIYNDTRSMFWNRAHALNTGLKIANGEILVVTDIDLILPSNFLEQISQFEYNSTFFTFNCYYLNEFCHNYHDIDLTKTDVGYVGLCAFSKVSYKNVNYFDEYFMIWGLEDDSFYKKLRIIGYNRTNCSINKFPVFHQWHPTDYNFRPTLWQFEMLNYYNFINITNNESSSGIIYTHSTRKSFKYVDNYKSEIKNTLSLYERPKIAFHKFYYDFNCLPNGEMAYFEFIFEKKSSKLNLSNIYHKIKCKLFQSSKLKIISDHLTYEIILEFLQYFIGKNRCYILDYYIECTNDKVLLILQKNGTNV